MAGAHDTDANGCAGDQRTRCPMCNYELRGLPQFYRCPECGYLYDPHATVIKLPGLSKYVRELGILLVVAVVLAWTWRSLPPSRPEAIAVMAVGGVLLMRSLYRLVSGVRVRPVVVLDQFGIHLRLESASHERLVHWADVKEARYSLWFAKLYLLDRDGRKILAYSWREFGAPRAARECASQINRLKALYSKR